MAPTSGPTDLLAAFSPDPAEALRRYLSCRTKVISICCHRGCPDPEAAAATVFVRVIAKLKEGITLTVPVEYYCLGVARMVALEELKERRDHVSFEEEFQSAVHFADPFFMILAKQCLELLPVPDRKFILEFYESGAKAFASSLGVTENAVRMRAFRIIKALRKSLNPDFLDEKKK